MRRPLHVSAPHVVAALVGAAILLLPALAGAGEADTFQSNLDQRGLLLTLLSSFGLGIAASLTPCVYPMIPIVVGVFGARDDAVTRRRAAALATSYVLGLAVVYTSLGIVFALIGKAGDQGQLLANPWVVLPLVAIYLALAASMFGAFELNLQAGLQSRLAQVGGKGYGGAFGMGMVGGFTAAPCTGPFLAGMLGWVAMTGDVVRGGVMLLSFALGMGVLFWVIAATSVSLPRSGRWMEWMKSIGGLALLAVAIYFLRPLVPALGKLTSPSAWFAAGSVALALVGIALGAVHLSFHGSARERVRKGIAVAVVTVGVTGALNWALTPDRKLPWRFDEAAAFAEARAQGKGVLIDFSATWCVPCKKLEVETFADGDVFDRIVDGYVPLKFDMSEDSELNDRRKERYRQTTMPEVILLDARGAELARAKGEIDTAAFLDKLREADRARRARTAER